MLFDELLVEAKLADLYRGRHGWDGGVRADRPAPPWPLPSYEPVTERPRADAVRILVRWLVARRAAVRALSRSAGLPGPGAAPAEPAR